MKNVFKFMILMCLTLAVSAGVFAQEVTTGSIGGTVVDSSGAAIPGAKIIVTGQTGERTAVTNEQGVYSVVVFMSVATTIVAPPLLKIAYRSLLTGQPKEAEEDAFRMV